MGVTFTCFFPGEVGGGVPPHGFVSAAGTTAGELDEGAGRDDELLDGVLGPGVDVSVGFVLDGGGGAGHATVNSTVAVPDAAGRFGPPVQWKLALYLPRPPAARPCPVKPGEAPFSSTDSANPADFTGPGVP